MSSSTKWRCACRPLLKWKRRPSYENRFIPCCLQTKMCVVVYITRKE
jgi:hypothetical protein